MAQLAVEPLCEVTMATGPSSTEFGRLTWEWIRLDTELGLNTDFENNWGGRWSTEVIYICSDFRDDKTRQAGGGVRLERSYKESDTSSRWKQRWNICTSHSVNWRFLWTWAPRTKMDLKGQYFHTRMVELVLQTNCMEQFYVFKLLTIYFSCLGEFCDAVLLWSSINVFWTQLGR